MRVSGGEPARSPHFWKFLDMCENDTFDFAINSNLIMPEDRLNKLIKSADKFKAMDIYTSAECLGKHQAFVRDGFDWDLWEKNLRTAYESKAFRALHIMMTISVLSVFGVSDFLKKIIEFRKEYNDKKAFNMSVNILRFPSFQSINMLHSDIKRKLAQELEDTINENSDWMQGHEINNFKRLVIYLRKVDVSYEDSDAYDKKQNDLKNFLEQYAIRREKPIKEYMPENFNKWYEQI
jgi:pyruvate-formate lyase-activating enzyme